MPAPQTPSSSEKVVRSGSASKQWDQPWQMKKIMNSMVRIIRGLIRVHQGRNSDGTTALVR
jgi:hypothetical protein